MISDANPDIWEVDVKTISFALLGAVALVVLAARFAAGQQQQQRPPAFERPPAEDAGLKIFNGQCMTCHGNPAVERAPAPAVIKQMTPERIYEALSTGGMKTQAENLTDAEKRQVAEFMGGRRLGTAQSGEASKMPNRCPISRRSRPGMVLAWTTRIPDTSQQRLRTYPSARCQG
jgi:mono/diheme cytochrome c family protein